MYRSALRRLWGLWLLAVLLLFPYLPAKAATAIGYGVVENSSYVNLRSQPTQSSTRLGYYQPGVWVEITGESDNWYSVNGPDGKSGWMSKNFIRVEPDVVQAIGIVTNPLERGYLNLRQTPSYSAKVLDYYYNGVPCTLQGLNDGWYQVNVDGKTGYFRSEYIRQHYWVGSNQVATVQTPNNTGLNLRTGPSTNYTSLRQFKGGTYVMVLQKGNDWWKVSVDGYVGFMSASFLRDGVIKPDFSSGSTPSQNKGYGIVTNPQSNQVLNLRESASTTSKVISQHSNGTRVTVLGQGTEWCKVRVDRTGKEGYMMTKYLTLYNLPSVPTMTVNHPKRSFVNLRSTPSMSGNQIYTHMPHGAVVTVLIPGGDWAKVNYNGYTGYAVTYFLK